MAKKYGLKKVRVDRFQSYFDHMKGPGMRLLSKMTGLETYPALPGTKLAGEKREYRHAKNYLREFRAKKRSVGTLSYPEWEVATLYTTFAFQKVSDKEIP